MSTVATTVEEGRFRGEAAMLVRAGALSATFLPDVGMTGVSLLHRDVEHLALPGGLAALRAGSTLGLPLLAPWANRLASRRYHAAGVAVDLAGLPLPEDGNGLPIHGFLVGQPGWRVGARSTRSGTARMAATMDVDAPAFPFPHRIELSIAARDDRLTVETTIVPTGERAVPVSFGWHPYLRLPGAARREWQLGLPARTHLALDERGIPTGDTSAERKEAARIGRRTFDDLYELGRQRSLSVETEGGASITMRCESGYPYAQLWVPAGRPFVALEPMTAPTNSLVEGTAPLVEPGDTYRARFSLVLGGDRR